MTAPRPMIDWPKVPGCDAVPEWRENHFVVGGTRQRVLSYGNAESHWTAELTALHELEAGSEHPIDRASRALAAASIQRFRDRPNPVVIDIGCSSGYTIDVLRRVVPRATVIGADFLVEILEKVAQRLPDVPLLQFDLRSCPLPDACVDAIIALNVLEHIDQDDLALAQLCRILRPGGIAHIEVPAGPHLYDIYDEQLKHHRRYRLAELVDKARRAGFAVLRATHLGVLVYPAFSVVKRRNRRLLFEPSEVKQRIVAKEIRRTSRSWLLRLLLAGEIALGRWVRYPVGIRCVLALRRPSV